MSIMGSLQALLRRGSFRTYLLVLCVLYLLMVLLFHADLQDSRRDPPHLGPRKTSSVVNVMNPGATSKPQPRPTDTPYLGRPPGIQKNVIAPRAQPPAVGLALDNHVEGGVRASSNERSGGDKPMINPRLPSDTQFEENGNCAGPDNGVEYQFVEAVKNRVFVYSAYFDRRPNDFDNKHNGSYLRIMTVFRDQGGNKPALQCAFKVNSGEVIYSEISYYEMCENHRLPFGGYILSCQVPQEIPNQPCSVSVMSQGAVTDIHSAPPLKVLSIAPLPNRNDFAICVSPIFGNINTAKLVEFIELSLLLGAQRINFYDFQVSEEVTKLLAHYQTRGQVSVIPWPYTAEMDRQSWYHGQLIAVQDCLYRNMRSAEYLAFNDMDEFIVPHAHSSWRQMIDETFNQQTQCAFQFHSAFFQKPPDGKPNNSSLFTMISTQRTQRFSNVRTKCMVKPYLIFEKGIHHVSKPIWANLDVKRMSEYVGFLHHYRVCMADFGMRCDGRVEDNRLAMYQETLESKVSQTLRDVQLSRVVP